MAEDRTSSSDAARATSEAPGRGAPRSSLPAPRPLTATYRVQLNKDFTLRDAARVVPYLHALGISHVYASPVLAARPGSTHGYDVADPARVNPELGGEEALRALADALHQRGMGLVLDIVPNHMGIGPGNPYWMDVLRHGRGSRWAHWFDIDWDTGGLGRRKREGKLVLPVLGDELDAVLARGELALEISEHEGAHFKYFENVFPIDPSTLPESLQLVQLDPNAREAAESFARGEEGAARLRALLEAQHYRLAFWEVGPQELNYRRFFDVNELAALRMEDPRVFEETHALVLALVRDGVVDGLRIDHVDGLRDPLGYLRRLRAAVGGGGRVAGGGEQRLDDGIAVSAPHLPPPTPFPIFVEKILSPGEHLRRDWPVDGTTGYEFLNDLEALYIEHEGALAIERAYQKVRRMVGRRRETTFELVAREGKLAILRGALLADMKRLARRLAVLMEGAARGEGAAREPAPSAAKGPPPHEQDRAERTGEQHPTGASSTERTERPPADGSPSRPDRRRKVLGDVPAVTSLTSGIIQLLASLPVYRTYIDGRTPLPSAEDRAVIEHAVARAQEHCGAREHETVSRIARALLAPLAGDDPDRAERLDFILTLQQTSGPATAKGVEDTALYDYVPLVSRNEVGGEPDRPLHDAVPRLHRANAERAAHWPRALLCTNTHDTKRSADLRARIDVVSESPEMWTRHFARWRRLNKRHHEVVEGKVLPDTNTEWLLYQTLVGLWPSPVTGRRVDDPPPPEWLREAAARVEEYMMKAVKEAKRHTSWTEPDVAYEQAIARFVQRVLDPASDSSPPFIGDLSRYVGTLARAGEWTALSRVLVHYTAPGTPDTYRGDELWSVALVDPDNRRPVDFDRRRRLLAELEELFPRTLEGVRRAERVRDLARTPEDDQLKLYVVWRLLTARREQAALFGEGSYLPLEAEGDAAAHVFAFARVLGDRSAIAIAPRLLQRLAGTRRQPVGSAWGNTALLLGPLLATPAGNGAAPRRWRCVLSGREVTLTAGAGARIPLSPLLLDLPMALLLPF